MMRQFVLVLLVFIYLCEWKLSEACSCMRKHPQAHYCAADFVILATPKVVNYSGQDAIYKLKIRNEFKMTEKSKLALKSGRLVTSVHESLCGVELTLNRTYLITGRLTNLEAQINLCNSYVMPWKSVTPRQRKGFKVLYKQGCQCKIQSCSNPASCQRRTSNYTCKWLAYSRAPNCQSDYGICLKNKHGMCDWAMARKLTDCVNKQSSNHDTRPKPTF